MKTSHKLFLISLIVIIIVPPVMAYLDTFRPIEKTLMEYNFIIVAWFFTYLGCGVGIIAFFGGILMWRDES